MRVFRDRRDGGAQLAHELQRFANRSDVIVLALPRGGVPVGYEIATRLGVSLDVLVVRKLGVPRHPELAMGAIASGGIEIIDDFTVERMHVRLDELTRVIKTERAELARRERTFRFGRPPVDVRGKTVLLVDDGLATGSTMLAAIEALRTRAPAAIVVAVPVAAPQICRAMQEYADESVCLHTPQHLYAVGIWYDDFEQTSDEEVRELLAAADRLLHARSHLAQELMLS